MHVCINCDIWQNVIEYMVRQLDLKNEFSSRKHLLLENHRQLADRLDELILERERIKHASLLDIDRLACHTFSLINPNHIQLYLTAGQL